MRIDVGRFIGTYPSSLCFALRRFVSARLDRHLSFPLAIRWRSLPFLDRIA